MSCLTRVLIVMMWTLHSMHRGINPPSKKTPLKSTNCPSPPFLGNPLLYIGFLWTPSPFPKRRIFQWTRKILKFSPLTSSYLLKVTKFLVKIAQFEFLVMTEKNIFLIKYFRFHFFYFFVKYHSYPPLKVEVLSNLPLPPFWNLVGGSPHPHPHPTDLR